LEEDARADRDKIPKTNEMQYADFIKSQRLDEAIGKKKLFRDRPFFRGESWERR
jgi:hypothetical protein